MPGDVETITFIRDAGRDKYGDRITAGSTQFDVAGCLFAPGPSREINFGAQQVDTDGTIYAPAGIDVRPGDQALRKGVLYNVVGQPQDWGSSGVVIVLKSVTG